ncbi:rhodanese-like domain-containing protein [Bacillus sp. FSL K6-3431]|uniref:rhodanese-like domain-containing protein n=1 Tax=Bacillus sp. FSL K6-3431 TaxID=2921500 RepID=UPI0030F7A35C
MNTITPKELNLKKEHNEVCILDVRAEEKYEKEHIKLKNIHSINVPKSLIFNLDDEQLPFTLPKDQEFVVTCTTGNSAKKCAAILENKGYNVTLLEGGISAWKEYHGKEENL